MRFTEVESTYICQLNKPENRAMLEGYKERKDKSYAELARYYKDIFKALYGTPAWGVSGVNKMFNGLTGNLRAVLYREKKGKTSAYAHAAKLLRDIDYFGRKEANPKYHGNYKLAPMLSNKELIELAAMK